MLLCTEYYCLWQEPDIGQDLQLPQLQTMDLPCFFFLTMLTMIAVTIAISTAQMIIVQILLTIHWNIRSTPYYTGMKCLIVYFIFTFLVSLFASLYGLKSMNSIPAIRRMETIRPITFRLPVNAPPIWFTISAIA